MERLRVGGGGMSGRESLEVLTIALSCLLHDIGKFERRASFSKKSHEEFSVEFVEKYLPDFKMKEKVKELVKIHELERKVEGLLKIVREADATSSSEREKGYSGSYESELRRLQHIFSKRYYYKLVPLSLQDIHDIKGVEQNKATPKEYKDLWEPFIQDFNRFNEFFMDNKSWSLDDVEGLRSYIDTLCELLRRYTFFIPSAPTIEEEVKQSLYAHLKSTAALGYALGVNGRIDGSLTIILGDVAGIQRYVYGSRSYKGALKMLRSRSIYLSLLTEAVCDQIILDLNLLPLNVVFCSGGHFMIIGYDLPEDKLDTILSKIERFLLERHEGDIGIKIAYRKVPTSDLRGEAPSSNLKKGVGEIINKMEPELKEAGLRMFHRLLKEDGLYNKVFGPIKLDRGVCYSCGSGKNVVEKTINEESNEESIPLCENCISLRELAKKLSKANYIIKVYWSPDRESKTVREASIDILGIFTGPLNFTLSGLDISYHLAENEGSVKAFLELLSKISDKARHVKIVKINDSDIVGGKLLESIQEVVEKLGGTPYTISLGFTYIAKHTPLTDGGEIKSFDDLARESVGSKMVGYLKLDLDHLGHLFKEHSGRMATAITFSEIISLIMEGTIDLLVSDKNIVREGVSRLYIVYSGGDDLFLTGSWNTVLEVVRELRKRLESLLRTEDGGPTISTAVIFEDPKTPVKIVGEELSRKLNIVKESGRNGIAITSNKIDWKSFEECFKLVEELRKLILSGELSRSFIFKLYTLLESYRRDHTWSKHRHMLYYIVSRHFKEDGLREKMVKKLSEALNLKYLEDVLLLVELYTREGY